MKTRKVSVTGSRDRTGGCITYDPNPLLEILRDLQNDFLLLLSRRTGLTHLHKVINKSIRIGLSKGSSTIVSQQPKIFSKISVLNV